jgi:hypothetical protein
MPIKFCNLYLYLYLFLQLARMTVRELRGELGRLGQPGEGDKNDLEARLAAALTATYSGVEPGAPETWGEVRGSSRGGGACGRGGGGSSGGWVVREGGREWKGGAGGGVGGQSAAAMCQAARRPVGGEESCSRGGGAGYVAVGAHRQGK